MGWFSRKPDAIDELCESLTERWWEWTPSKTLSGKPQLVSLSGLVVVIDGTYSGFGTEVGGFTWLGRETERVKECYYRNLMNRHQAKKANFGDTAKALAEAVLRGDQTAAIGLADWVKENLGDFDGRR